MDELAWHMDLHRSSLVLELHKVLALHKELELVQHRVLGLELHRSSSGLVLQHRCKPSCVHADGSKALLALQQVHKQVRRRKQVLGHMQEQVLVHSKMLRLHHCSPSYDQKLQPKHWKK